MRQLAPLLLGLLLTGAQAEEDSLRQLGQQSAQLRGLSYQPVASQRVSQKECVDYLLRLLDEEMTPAQTLKREVFLKLLGLMPESASMKKTYAELYTDQVRGLYDPKRKRYLVVSGAKASADPMAAGLGLNMESLLTVHELGHAIQDQHFQLGALTQRVAADFDQELAASCLIEGDASALMMVYALKSMGMEGMDMGAMGGLDQEQLMLGSSPALAKAPRFFREVVAFPYNQGLIFVSTLKGRGNWAAVNRAFQSLPESTEQILHPEKYQRDHPQKVTLPTSVSRSPSLGQDTAGEFTIRCWAREQGAGDEIAAGWGGDRYESFQDSSAIWVTTWDRDQDAREFEKMASQALSSRRAPSGRSNRVQRQGREVTLWLNLPAK